MLILHWSVKPNENDKVLVGIFLRWYSETLRELIDFTSL